MGACHRLNALWVRVTGCLPCGWQHSVLYWRCGAGARAGVTAVGVDRRCRGNWTPLLPGADPPAAGSPSLWPGDDHGVEGCWRGRGGVPRRPCCLRGCRAALCRRAFGSLTVSLDGLCLWAHSDFGYSLFYLIPFFLYPLGPRGHQWWLPLPGQWDSMSPKLSKLPLSRRWWLSY